MLSWRCGLKCVSQPVSEARAKNFEGRRLRLPLQFGHLHAVSGNLTGGDARPTLWRGRPRPRLEPPKRPAAPGKLNLNGLKRGVGLLAGLVSCAHQATPAKSSACTLNCKSY